MKKLGFTLIIELLLFIVLIISIVYSLINKVYMFTEMTTGVLLILMGYNNHKYIKKRRMTVIYIIFGIVVLLSTVFKMIYG